MKKTKLLLLVLSVILITFLTGCGQKKGVGRRHVRIAMNVAIGGCEPLVLPLPRRLDARSVSTRSGSSRGLQARYV